VNAGEVRIGGHNIKELRTERLLSYISMVFQDVYLFHDTVLNNLRVGHPNATGEEIGAAARAAQCHEFITRLPQGYDTIVGEGGSTLSGGEKQRLSIARAILKNAPIVLLDEATASLDPENEVLIQRGFHTLVRAKTLVVIAHRLSTIRHADQILVIDKGRIVERGKHDDLIAIDGLYAKLWREQERAHGWKVAA
jgi:ATP-binding cassette subfamily B protein